MTTSKYALKTYRTWKVLYAKQPTPDKCHVELKDNSSVLLPLWLWCRLPSAFQLTLTTVFWGAVFLRGLRGKCPWYYRFHTYDYARHFVSACTRILGLEGTPEGVEDQGKLTRVAAVWSQYPNDNLMFFDNNKLNCIIAKYAYFLCTWYGFHLEISHSCTEVRIIWLCFSFPLVSTQRGLSRHLRQSQSNCI